MILALALLSLGSNLAPNAAALEASRAVVLRNALRGIDLRKAANLRGIDLRKAANVSLRAAMPERCVIPMRRVPADPNIDPKIVLPVPNQGDDRMPRFQGPPLCSAR